jgi:hypothetical protein
VAGRGPAPKPREKRAGHGKDPLPLRSLQLVRKEAPELPELGPDAKGNPQEWHPRTRDWWAVWAESELSKDFTGTDWSFLIDTALMHHAVWAKGQWTLAAELRLRVAKMGATPEDRARLRITFADADEKDEKRAAREAGSVRARYGGAGRAVGSD